MTLTKPVLISCLFVLSLIGCDASAQRLTAAGDMTFLVSALGKDTTACGASGTPCATKQGAMNAALRYDALNYKFTIADPYCADSGPLSILPLMGTNQPLTVSLGTGGNFCPVIGGGTGSAITISGSMLVILNGANPSTTGTGNDLLVSNHATVYVGPINYGQSGGDHNVANNGGAIMHTAPFTISGGALRWHDHIPVGGTIGAENITVTLVNNPTFGQCFVGVGYGYASYVGMTFSGQLTCGSNNLVHLSGAIKLAGAILPGGDVNGQVNNRGGNVDDNIGTTDLDVYGNAYLRGGMVDFAPDGISSHGATISFDANKQLRLDPYPGRCTVLPGQNFCPP